MNFTRLEGWCSGKNDPWEVNEVREFWKSSFVFSPGSEPRDAWVTTIFVPSAAQSAPHEP